MSFNRFLLLLPVLFLTILFAFPVFAEAEQGQSHDTAAGLTGTVNSAPVLLDITSECSRGTNPDFKNEKIIPAAPREFSFDSSMAFSRKYFGSQPALTVYDTRRTSWCLESLSEKLILDPMANIRNLEVMLQYKF